ncbi:hypothetical protein GH714_000270 [Hevea brasiliensis]|uniref:Uncharacterized protein n=1 Tax=Hevea brasiliensis TaxID=3981 RepID=A0A6A6M3U4_HEVBR|nr:hypothetical protein GH714_000270 [Hevea brasiliensis]
MDYVPFSVTKNLSELNDRRCKGLCLWCDEQFTSSHNCDKAPFMVSIINDILDEEGDDENKEELQEIQENVSAIDDTVQQDWPSTVVNGNVQQEYPPILQPLECSKWDKEDQDSENSTFSLLQISLSDDQNFLQMEDHATMPVLLVCPIQEIHYVEKPSIPAENLPLCTAEPNKVWVNILNKRCEGLYQLDKPKSELAVKNHSSEYMQACDAKSKRNQFLSFFAPRVAMQEEHGDVKKDPINLL